MDRFPGGLCPKLPARPLPALSPHGSSGACLPGQTLASQSPLPLVSAVLSPAMASDLRGTWNLLSSDNVELHAGLGSGEGHVRGSLQLRPRVQFGAGGPGAACWSVSLRPLTCTRVQSYYGFTGPPLPHLVYPPSP